MYVYEVDGRKFVQKMLVWGQVKQLLSVIKGIEFPQGATTANIIEILGDKIPLALAVVLTEEGQSLKDKDLTALASEFEFLFPIEMIVKVVEDFFVCNPMVSLLEKVQMLVGGLNEKVVKTTESTESSSSSQGETSAIEM